MYITHTLKRRALLLWVPLAIMLLEVAHPVGWSGHVHGPETLLLFDGGRIDRAWVTLRWA